jgi:hypothetical protein
MIVDEYREGHIEDIDKYYDEFKPTTTDTARLHVKPTAKDFKEIDGAYSDCVEERMGKRALQYHSDALMNADELRKAFKIVTDNGGYNEFDSEALEAVIKVFGDETVYQPAREYSVCIYVHLKPHQHVWFDNLTAAKVDEISLKDDVVRLWWD